MKVVYIPYFKWEKLKGNTAGTHPHQKHISIAKIIADDYYQLDVSDIDIYSECKKLVNGSGWFCNVFQKNSDNRHYEIYQYYFSTLEDFEKAFYPNKHAETIMELEL